MTTTLLYSDALKNYDFGVTHPFRSDRFNSFLNLYKEKLGNNKNFKLVRNDEFASDEELRLWHTKEYIQALKTAAAGKDTSNLYTFVSQDNLNPLTGNFPKSIEKAARSVVKNSILAVDYVWRERTDRAVSIGGGLHHARSNYGEGFCIYNDVVIAAKHALNKYHLEKMLILDTDAHAGNGTCEAFFSDPRVLFIDLHQKGIYPGTGFINEIGAGRGKGFTVNIPLDSRSGDTSYELIFDEVILPLAEAFKPQMIIRNGGSDPHFKDGLTSLGLTLKGFKMIGEKVKEVSRKECANRSVDLICSGYNPEILPKVWLTLVTSLSGEELELTESPYDNIETLERTRSIIAKIKDNLKSYWRL